MNNERAPIEQVKAHAKALHRRNQWRKKYYDIATTIRELKEDSKWNPSCMNSLRALQEYANDMMVQRETIRSELESTAYEWV